MLNPALSRFVVSRLLMLLTAPSTIVTVLSFITVLLFTRPVNAQPPDRTVPPAEQRSDSFEAKLKLLQDAWERKDYDLARSLTHSLRDSVIRTQDEEQSPGTPLIPAPDFHRVTTLPESWQRWAAGWTYFKTISVAEPTGEARRSEPVEVLMSFPHDQIASAAREVRIARQSGDRLVEVPCQVFSELRRNDQRYCRILWMADSQPHEHQTYFCFYGNPDAELPSYPSDLETTGEGFGLDISNSVFKASLSRQTGQLERMTLRREHGLELFSGGEGHGEPPGIDWAHDYVDENFFQKLRISLWETCPDYEVVRGPLCTIVRRWGFPRSPIHPIDTPARLKVDVEYRFYSGLPWFHKTGSMTAVQSFRAEALRDDEWVFSGQSFTDKLWMDRNGKLNIGDVPPESQKDIHGVGFFHKDSQDSFLSLFLDHSAEGLPELAHTGSPTLYYRWHGAVWSRYPLPLKDVPAGAVLRQKNAYISIPFTKAEGPAEIERMHRCLMNPLKLTAGNSQQTFDNVNPEKRASDSVTMQLARPGEAADSPVPKQEIWNALRDCKDAQLYTADINLVDLGLIRDIRVRGDVVTVVLTMPHRGRSRPGYFVDGSISVHPTRSVPIRERLMQITGVRQVVVEHSWEPRWSSNDLTQTGREKLRMPTLDPSH
jgi:metal-sulfur cluster biosynthetic enzyme